MRRIGLAVVFALNLAITPLAVEAQPTGKVPRIGYLVLSPLADPPSAERQAFLSGLHELGYIERQNIAIEYRSAKWNRELLPDLAHELVDLKVDVIVAIPGAIDAARNATKTIPIVVPAATDPVESGLVKSLARPGGNITGTAVSTTDLTGKRLQLLKEVFPKMSRVTVLWSPASEAPLQWKATQAAARGLGVLVESLEVRDPKDFLAAFSAITRRRPDALLTFVSPLTTAYRPIIVEFATKNRLPTMFGVREDVVAGGLMSYAANVPHIFGRAAGYVDKILKGSKPGDLPMEQPVEFELIINLKTAETLGLTIPPSLLLRADELIQ